MARKHWGKTVINDLCGQFSAPLSAFDAAYVDFPERLLADAAETADLVRICRDVWFTLHGISSPEYPVLLTILLRCPRGNSKFAESVIGELTDELAGRGFNGEHKRVWPAPFGGYADAASKVAHWNEQTARLAAVLPNNLRRRFLRKAGDRVHDGIIFQVGVNAGTPRDDEAGAKVAISPAALSCPEWLSRERGLFESVEFGPVLDESTAEDGEEEFFPD